MKKLLQDRWIFRDGSNSVTSSSSSRADLKWFSRRDLLVTPGHSRLKLL